jgi:hypothetical protein
MKELFRICSEKSNHRFAATESWRYREECPYCKCKMNLVEVETIEPSIRRRATRRSTRDKDATGYNRGLIIDSLPRLPWFAEAIEYNEVDQDRAGDIWTLSEAKELLSLYDEYGMANAATWNALAASLGRSLFAVERQLRIIVNHQYELEKHYPAPKLSKLMSHQGS